MKKSYAIKTPIKNAEKINQIIKKNNLRNKNLKLKKDTNYIYYPIIKEKFTSINKANNFIGNIQKENNTQESIEIYFLEEEFEERKQKIKSYKENIKIPKNLEKNLPTSYDIIGNIALIKIPEKLLKHKKNIGEAILKSKKNIQTVCIIKPVKGELRTRKIEIIAGKKQTKTIHKEFGLAFFVDVKDSYFSPRLANERKRITKLVKKDEIIVDMFTGVAPFAVMIAKYCNPKIIYAVDKNKKAISLAEYNVRINKVVNKITLFNKDSKDIKKILEKEQITADRIIMNLPFLAYDFFTYALDIISEKCIIHYYCIIDEKDTKKTIESLRKIANKKNIKIVSYNIRKIKSYSPLEFYMGIDIMVKKIELPM
jgi:tRNA (guanine37-N1)-methyltransferase